MSPLSNTMPARNVGVVTLYFYTSITFFVVYVRLFSGLSFPFTRALQLLLFSDSVFFVYSRDCASEARHLSTSLLLCQLLHFLILFSSLSEIHITCLTNLTSIRKRRSCFFLFTAIVSASYTKTGRMTVL